MVFGWSFGKRNTSKPSPITHLTVPQQPPFPKEEPIPTTKPTGPPPLNSIPFIPRSQGQAETLAFLSSPSQKLLEDLLTTRDRAQYLVGTTQRTLASQATKKSAQTPTLGNLNVIMHEIDRSGVGAKRSQHVKPLASVSGTTGTAVMESRGGRGEGKKKNEDTKEETQEKKKEDDDEDIYDGDEEGIYIDSVKFPLPALPWVPKHGAGLDVLHHQPATQSTAGVANCGSEHEENATGQLSSITRTTPSTTPHSLMPLRESVLVSAEEEAELGIAMAAPVGKATVVSQPPLFHHFPALPLRPRPLPPLPLEPRPLPPLPPSSAPEDDGIRAGPEAPAQVAGNDSDVKDGVESKDDSESASSDRGEYSSQGTHDPTPSSGPLESMAGEHIRIGGADEIPWEEWAFYHLNYRLYHRATYPEVPFYSRVPDPVVFLRRALHLPETAGRYEVDRYLKRNSSIMHHILRDTVPNPRLAAGREIAISVRSGAPRLLYKDLRRCLWSVDWREFDMEDVSVGRLGVSKRLEEKKFRPPRERTSWRALDRARQESAARRSGRYFKSRLSVCQSIGDLPDPPDKRGSKLGTSRYALPPEVEEEIFA